MDEQRQTNEVRETNEQDGDTSVKRQTVATRTTVPGSVVAQRVVYYIGGIIIGLLLLRVIFLLLGANQGNAFVDILYAVSGFFAIPFYGIFSYQPAYGRSVFEVSSVVAIVVYALITWALARLFTLGSSHPEAQT